MFKGFFKLAFLALLCALVFCGCSQGGDSSGSGSIGGNGVGGNGNAVPTELVGKWVNGTHSVEFSTTQFRGTDTGTGWYTCRVTSGKIEYNLPPYGWFMWCESYTISGGTIVFIGGESRPGAYTKQ